MAKAKQAKQPKEPRPPTRPPTPKQQKILDTAAHHPNLSMREIGAIADTDHAHVIRTLQTYGIIRDRVEAFKRSRADVFAGFQEKIMASITPEEIQKAPFGSRITAAAILYDKERLERDLSTSNVASVIGDIEAIRAMREAGK